MSLLTNSHHIYWEDNLTKCLKLLPPNSIPNDVITLLDNRAWHLILTLERLYSDRANNTVTDTTDLVVGEDLQVIVYILTNYFRRNNINNKISFVDLTTKKQIQLKNTLK
jgi:hypothetical protein